VATERRRVVDIGYPLFSSGTDDGVFGRLQVELLRSQGRSFMPVIWQTVYIFISSTFRNTQAAGLRPPGRSGKKWIPNTAGWETLLECQQR
jgi:hypothetical protein